MAESPQVSRIRAFFYFLIFPLFGPPIGFVFAILVEGFFSDLSDLTAIHYFRLMMPSYVAGTIPAALVGAVAAWQLRRHRHSRIVVLLGVALAIIFLALIVSGAISQVKLILMMVCAGCGATLILRVFEPLFRGRTR